MFTIIDNGRDAVLITASDRNELNSKTNKLEDKIWEKYGDCTYNESRNYGTDKPDLGKLNLVLANDFKPMF